MSDVLLLDQYFWTSKEKPELIGAILPINLLYLASYLKRAGVDCKIAELGKSEPTHFVPDGTRVRSGLADDEIAAILTAEKPRLVGIGCMFTRHYPETLAIAEFVRRTCPDARIVFGGNHASCFPEQCLKNKAVDFVVIGEGEKTLLDLAQHVLSGRTNWSEIDGLAYRNETGQTVRSKPRDLIKNLDDLVVDYNLVDVKRYTAPSVNSPFLMRAPNMGIITSRGCPNKCVYCTVKNIYGRTWRSKSAKKTVDEIEFLHKQYGFGEFAILDDSASLDKKRWNEICNEIITRKLDIRWTTPNGIAHWTLDEPTLDKMKEAGCYRVTFGIESGFEATRKYLGKPYPLSQARDMIRHANRIGMWTICTNIIGFPDETGESMDATVRFAKESGADFATFYLLQPHLASEVYSHFKQAGLINFDHLLDGDNINPAEYEIMTRTIVEGGSQTKHFTAEELRGIQNKAYRSFLTYRILSCVVNPLRILRKIRSLEDFRYMAKLGLTGLSMLARTFRIRNTASLLYTNTPPTEEI